MSRAPDTGETTAAIHKRADDVAWPAVKAALERGATLFRPTRMTSFFVDADGRLGGGSLTAARVKRLERDGVLQHVGVDRYGLVPK